jgi:DNA-binding NarL/FixJ family response regulator
VRLVIAEDSVLLREGLVRLLTDRGHEVVAAAHDGVELLAAVEQHGPDGVITDVRMPPTQTDEGLRAAITIRQRWPQTLVLVLSQYVEPRYATELLQGDTRGVGYLLKDRVADVRDFLDAIDRLAAGGTVLDPDIVSEVLARSRRRDRLAALTGREREVLTLMAEGRTNTAIASELVVTGGAVEKHITNIFTKLELHRTDDDHRRVLAVLAWLEG